jgi:UDP-N-acetylglucosamine--N-acetylmuramyl-(pentapeptide) pyrophosphoryl-undecaprenol N-acetylglucosamine transferase
MTEALPNLPDNIELREFITDMPKVMGQADLVLCRAGASTLAEICAAAKPSVLVPSPNVTNNHQDANAGVLERAGAALKLPEADCTGDTLYTRVKALITDREKLSAMSAAAENLSTPDSAERIYRVIMNDIGAR